MNLHTDIPTRAQLERLLDHRHERSVSIYLPTDPPSNGEAERIELGNLVGEARRQLEQDDAVSTDLRSFEELLADILEDETFWRYQARSLALFATPEGTTTFRLPNKLQPLVEVSDRFHVKPLLRALTFPRWRSCSHSRRGRCD